MTDMSNNADFESVKKEIRALLISSQTGVPLYNFADDYYEVVGVPLDFTSLGFFDLETFLRAIPDVVCIVEDFEGQKILKHVSAESTKHIEKLVERQKPSANTKRTRKTRGASSSATNGSTNGFQSQQNHYTKSVNRGRNNNNSNGRFLPSPTFSNNYPSGYNRKSGYPSTGFVPPSSKCLSSSRVRPSNNGGETSTFRRPSLPNFIRIQIQQTLASFSEPVSQSVFEAAYKENFGAYLNIEKCGFGSLDDLLQSIPDTVKRTLKKNGEPGYQLLTTTVPSDQQQHQQQRGRLSPFNPKANCSFSSLTNAYLEPHSPKHSGFKPISNNVLRSTSPLHSNSYAATMVGGFGLSSGYPHLNNSSSQDKKYKDSRKSPTAMVSPNNFVRDFNEADDIDDFWIDDFEMSINTEVTRKIEKVMEKHPNGLYASMLCSEYKKIHGQDLDYRDLGYLSVIELVSKLKSVRIVRPTVSGDWLLFDTRKPLAAVEKMVADIRCMEISKNSYEKRRENAVRLNISKMLEMIPEGVNLDQFMEYYRKITGDDFQPEDFGFKSLESYILSLASNIVEISYTGNACVTVKSIKTAKQEKNLASPAGLHDSTKSKNGVCSNFSQQLPEDAVGPGVSYRRLDIWTNKEYVEVFVSNIETPGNFCIQFGGRQHSVALEKLMDELEVLYCSAESNAYQVPDEFIQVGLVAVAVYPEDQNWHRILITSVPNLSYVEVHFVDYGNRCIVPRKSLRLLRRNFLTLPMQAVEARLANVKPVGDKWTIKARNRMLDLCSNKPLVALITQIKDRVISLCLIDTSLPTIDIHINDLLVQEKYCCFSPDNTEYTKIPGSATFDVYHSNLKNPTSTASGEYFQIQPQQFQQGTQKTESQQQKDLSLKPAAEKTKPSINRPTSIQRPSPSVSPTFGTQNNLKQNPKVNNLTLNSINNLQRHENIARPTSISTTSSSSSNVNQGKIARKSTSANDNFMLPDASVNNHIPKNNYPISKGNDVKPFVKKVQLTEDHAIHIFNFNGTACIASCDLSAFLWKFDIIRTMLRSVNLGISKVIICEEYYGELFSELKKINFSGLWIGKDRKDWVTLFRLEDVPVVLETFNHPSAELKLAVQAAIRDFDPNDTFWKVNGEENAEPNAIPLSKQSSPKPIPKSLARKQSPTVYSEQSGLSSSASPPQFYFGKGSPSQRSELKSSSAESSPRSRRPSSVTLEDIKTINANITHLHKARQRLIYKKEKENDSSENYAKMLQNIEKKLQKLNALLIKASPTVENKDPPGQGRLISPYQNSSNCRLTPSPAGSLGLSPRDSRSAFQSPSPSPVPESTPLTPQVLSQMLDSQYAALFAASGMSATPSDPLVAVNNSYSSGVSSCTSSNLNTPASPFSPSRNSPPSRDANTSGANLSTSSPRLLPGLYPLLHQQSPLQCLGRGSSISSLSISPPIWPGSASPSPGFMGHTHSPSRSLAFSPSPSSPSRAVSLPNKGHN